eukprot:CAMPEP_0119344034 /NCGR_PEP_ID=MMETSP1333-20130426/106762_1 /TAXON_ID=418940 /ORGANISM="Scyphosphaera apsteinii, Strain RCC1455" /LENGTH=245 /DNA_ID=CAMNT_0007356457 /DNA_START=31 /DNA_END=769 /DNA_ORIENTATION=+
MSRSDASGPPLVGLPEDAISILGGYLADLKMPTWLVSFASTCSAVLTTLQVGGQLAKLHELHLAARTLCKKAGSSWHDVHMSRHMAWGARKIDNADCVVLSKIFASGALPQLMVLRLNVNHIGDPGLIALSDALGKGVLPGLLELYLNDKDALAMGALSQLLELRLDSNQIGDVGLAAFAEAVGKGVLVQLELLDLEFNRIGNLGLAALAEALGKGALAGLKVLVVYKDAPALRAACEARAISYH